MAKVDSEENNFISGKEYPDTGKVVLEANKIKIEDGIKVEEKIIEELNATKVKYNEPSEVVVKYLEEGTELELSEEKIISGIVGKEYSTERKDIDYYESTGIEPENAKGIMNKETTYVKYYYKKLPVNFSVENKISEITVNGKKLEIGKDNKIAKIELKEDEISNTEVLVKLQIIVKNNGKISGKVNINETIPAEYELITNELVGWEKSENQLYTMMELEPGEEKILGIILKGKNGNNNLGNVKSEVKITNIENIPGFEENNVEDNSDTIDFIIGIYTGIQKDTIKQFETIISTLLIVGATIIILKTRVKKGKHFK